MARKPDYSEDTERKQLDAQQRATDRKDTIALKTEVANLLATQDILEAQKAKLVHDNATLTTRARNAEAKVDRLQTENDKLTVTVSRQQKEMMRPQSELAMARAKLGEVPARNVYQPVQMEVWQ